MNGRIEQRELMGRKGSGQVVVSEEGVGKGKWRNRREDGNFDYFIQVGWGEEEMTR